MAYTTIDKSDEHFNIVLWTGDASSDKSISGVGFQPDWVWAKNRSDSNDHQLLDSNRGAGKILRMNNRGPELTRSSDVGAGGLQNFETDGFDVHSTSTNTNLNDNGELNVAWCWKANGGTTSSNSDGSITSTVQANTTAGFSIVTWTGTGSNATIGHGLGKAPKVVINKGRGNTDDWLFFHGDLDQSKTLWMNSTDSVKNESTYYPIFWNSTDPTSSVVHLGTNAAANGSSVNHVAYCFAEIQGYSKFGLYMNQGNVDGTFVYTGFTPSYVMFKQTNSSDTAHWFIYDTTRSPTNVIGDDAIAPNLSTAEGLGNTWNPNTSDSVVDFLSNGFKIRTTATSGFNIDGNTMMYFAFAEHPFVSSKGVPVTAR